MKASLKALIFIPLLLFTVICLLNARARVKPQVSEPLAYKQYLSVTPDLKNATVNEGRGKLPFIVKNNFTQGVSFVKNWYVVNLMTEDNAGNKVTIEDFRDMNRIHMSGGMFTPIVLKPGESGTYDSQFSMETMAFVDSKHKKIFGAFKSSVPNSTIVFMSCSDPFSIPSALTKPPWDDLGKQSYLSVTVDSAKPYDPEAVASHSAIPGRWGRFIAFPIKITNVVAQSFIVNSVHISFCGGEKAITLWRPMVGTSIAAIHSRCRWKYHSSSRITNSWDGRNSITTVNGNCVCSQR